MDFEFRGNTWSNHPEYDKGFKAGQQSKQDDLDELQKRINDALNEIELGITGKHHVKSIINILKGIKK